MHLRILILALAACTGGKPAAKRGPDPAWRATIEKDTYDAVAAGGGLVTVGEHGVALHRDGATAWTRTLPAAPTGWLVAAGDAVLAGDDDGHVVAIGVADGAIRWSVQTPYYEDGREPPHVRAAAMAAGRTVLLDGHNRFLALDLAACATGAETCMTETGGVKSTFAPTHLALADDGVRIAWDMSAVALYDPAGQRIAAFRARDFVAGAVTVGNAVVVAHDAGVTRLHPATCQVDVDTVIDFAAADDAPAGCMEVIHRGPVDSVPAASTAGIAWVNEQEVAGAAGAKTWRIGMEQVHVGSELVGAGPVAFVACWQEPEGNDMFVTQPDLCTIDLATGAVPRRSRLGIRAQGLLHDPWIVVSDTHVFVGLGDQLAAVPRG